MSLSHLIAAAKQHRLLLAAYAFLFLFAYLPFLKIYGWTQAQKGALDFPSYYAAGKLISDENVSPYLEEHWEKAQSYLPDEKVFAFLYPPSSLVIFKPLSQLNYQTAKIVFLALNHLLFAGSLLLLIKSVRIKLTNVLLPGLLLYALTFYPLIQTLDYGQANIIILFLLCWFWFAFQRSHHPLMVALPLSLAILLKVYPGIFILFLLLNKRYREVTYSLMLLVVFGLLSGLLLPSGIWQSWVTEVALPGGYLTTLRGQYAGAHENQSWNGFMARLALGGERIDALLPQLAALARPLTYLGAVSLLAAVTIPRIRNRYLTASRDQLQLEFCIYLLAMHLLAPITWDHHFVILLPVVFVFGEMVRDDKLSMLAIGTGIGALFVLGMKFPFRNRAFMHGLSTLAISLKFYVLLFLFGFFYYYWLKDIRTATPPAVKQQ